MPCLSPPATQPSLLTWFLGIQLWSLQLHSKRSHPLSLLPSVPYSGCQHKWIWLPVFTLVLSEHCLLLTGFVCFSYEFPINPFAHLPASAHLHTPLCTHHIKPLTSPYYIYIHHITYSSSHILTDYHHIHTTYTPLYHMLTYIPYTTYSTIPNTHYPTNPTTWTHIHMPYTICPRTPFTYLYTNTQRTYTYHTGTAHYAH